MRLILLLFKRLTFQRPHDDNLRASEVKSYQTINGYAVMCKVH
jgi:hypothetical protein